MVTHAHCLLHRDIFPLVPGSSAGQWQAGAWFKYLFLTPWVAAPVRIFFFLIRSVWRSEKGMSGVDWKPLDLQGVTGSHRARNKGGKKNPTTFTASWRCAACLSRPLAPHHSCDKMLFSFLRCAQVPIQMNITHRPLSKHCAVFKG